MLTQTLFSYKALGRLNFGVRNGKTCPKGMYEGAYRINWVSTRPLYSVLDKIRPSLNIVRLILSGLMSLVLFPEQDSVIN